MFIVNVFNPMSLICSSIHDTNVYFGCKLKFADAGSPSKRHATRIGMYRYFMDMIKNAAARQSSHRAGA